MTTGPITVLLIEDNPAGAQDTSVYESGIQFINMSSQQTASMNEFMHNIGIQ